MTDYYIVMAIGWDYNDEYMYKSEHGGGRPLAVFTSKAEAEAHRIELDLKACRETNLVNYCSEDGPLWSFGEEAMKVLVDAGLCTMEDLKDGYHWDLDLRLKNFTDEQIKEFLSKVTEPLFHEVVKVTQ